LQHVFRRRKRVHRASAVSALVALVVVLPLASVAAALAAPAVRVIRGPHAVTPTAQDALPLAFEPNVGQTDPRVRYVARGRGYALYLTSHEDVLVLARGTGDPKTPISSEQMVVRFKHGGEALRGRLAAAERLAGRNNYLLGKDPEKWHTNVATYARVARRGVSPGVDVVYSGRQGEVAFGFEFAPGATPDPVHLEVEGVDDMFVGEGGDLVLSVGGRELRMRRPVVMQQSPGGVTRAVPSRYTVAGRRVGFELGDYDPTKALAVEPVLVYSTFLGGLTGQSILGGEFGNDVAVDAQGAAYVTGITDAVDFPTTAGAYDERHNGAIDVFVTKLNPGGTSAAYSTLVGGISGETSYGIAVDSAGSAYVTGITEGFGYPATVPAFTAGETGSIDVFVTKLSPSGDAIVYSALLGGSSVDEARAITVGPDGAAYIAGRTSGSGFPTTAGAVGSTFQGGGGVFVTKLSPTGTSLVFSSTFGPGSGEHANDVALGVDGSIFVVGEGGSGYPTTPGAFDETYSDNGDAFVTKLAPSGGSLVYSTYLGASRHDEAYGVEVDADGFAYVVGQTSSPAFPVTPGAFDTQSSGSLGGFAAKLNPLGSGLVYSTFLEGIGSEYAYDVAIDASGSAYVVGLTTSSDFPVTAGAYDGTYGGGQDGFLTKVSPAGDSLAYSTFLGGAAEEVVNGVAVDASGSAFVAGRTRGTDFPVTPGAYDTTFGGIAEAFITTVNAGGSGLDYSSFLGGATRGNFVDQGFGVALDASGAVYVVGTSDAVDFPVTPGAFSTTQGGVQDVVLTKIDAARTGIVYATYIGGTAADIGYDVAVDPTGAAYVAGSTRGGGFPTTAGAFAEEPLGLEDGFVTKLAPGGDALAYSTYLGGTHEESCRAIAVSAGGIASVTGTTFSVDFPLVMPAIDTTRELREAYLTTLDAAGSALIGSTYLGGPGDDAGADVAVDASGAIYLIGTTAGGFPVTPGSFDTLSGGSDAFVAKVAQPGGAFAYATYLGGASGESGAAIAVGPGGAAYVVGKTNSPTFPTTPGAYDRTYNDVGDLFVTRLDATGAALGYSTFLGGTWVDDATAVAVDAEGSAYVAGYTESVDFPTTLGALDRTPNGMRDGIVARLTPSGSGLIASTYLGGMRFDSAQGIAIGSAGAYVMGTTESHDFPTTGSPQRPLSGAQDTFLVYLDLANRPPSANAGPDQAVGACTAVTLAAGGSSDPDGAPHPLSFAWTQTSGPAVSLFGTATMAPTFEAPNVAVSETLVFEVRVSDGLATASDTVSITVNRVDGAHVDTAGLYTTGGNTFFLRNCNGAGPADVVTFFGSGGLLPLRGDWDGDGIDTLGAYDPISGCFFLRNSIAPGPADLVVCFGAPGSVPLVGDWDGDGLTTVGTYHAASGTFFLRNSNTPGPADVFFTFGAPNSTPLVGDWNGDGATTVGVYLGSSGAFFLTDANEPGPANVVFTYGPAGVGLRPVIGDWDGTGGESVGLFDPSTGAFFLKNSNSPGGADIVFTFGVGGAVTPLAGNWDGL
jgi:hypothetical protein